MQDSFSGWWWWERWWWFGELCCQGHRRLTEEGGGALGLEGGAILTRRRREDTVGQGELEVLSEELLEVGTLGLGRLDGLHLEDLDARRGDAMLARHLRDELIHSADAGRVTELLPDVVVGRAALVAQRDAVVLELGGTLLGELAFPR